MRSINIIVFHDFELLDVFGPVELFSRLPDDYELRYVAERPGLVASSQGVRIEPQTDLHHADAADILLVPGGQGTRRLVNDTDFLNALGELARSTPLISSVCTGSALLAAAGLLEGYRATSNKRAFAWASSFGETTTWIRQARWIADRDRWTSSGIAAGMDMTAALIAEQCGTTRAKQAAHEIELEIHTDPGWDPFGVDIAHDELD